MQVREMRVDIETCSSISAGQTVCDIWHQSTRPKNCFVAMSMDVDAFWALILDALDRADAASPMNATFQNSLLAMNASEHTADRLSALNIT